jgi:hypothetical protein
LAMRSYAQGDLVGEGRERMRRAHGIDPGAVVSFIFS